MQAAPLLFFMPAATRYLFLAAALLALHGWTAVQHILPWPAFNNEWPFVAALLMLAVPALRTAGVQRSVPTVLMLPLLLVLVPLAQFATGKIVFFGDALMAALYLFALWLACVVGSRLDAAHGDRFAQVLAATILAGALVSVLLAAQQWLRIDLLGVWVADMRSDSRPYANLAQPNNLATLLCLGLAAALYLRERGMLGRSLLWVAALLLIAGVAMTRSRMALLAVGAMLVWLLAHRSCLAMATSAREGIAGLACCIGLWMAWPVISELLQVHADSRLEGAFGGNVRLVIWRELLDAAFRNPWSGYGWNQVSVAQMSVAADHPSSVFVEHAHNVVIDLLIWNGVALGGLIVVALVAWAVSRSLRIRSLEAWFGMLALIVAGVHAMFELPLEYAYFLLPLGLCVGIVERRHPGSSMISLPGRATQVGAVLACSLFAAVFVEYQTIEADFRRMRFEAAKIEKRPEIPTAPDVVLLTQLREYIRFARTDAREGMSEEELRWMRNVAHRFPFAPALFRHVLALALNGRYEEARTEFVRFQRLHSPAHYDEAVQNLHALASKYPELLRITSDSALSQGGPNRHPGRG